MGSFVIDLDVLLADGFSPGYLAGGKSFDVFYRSPGLLAKLPAIVCEDAADLSAVLKASMRVKSWLVTITYAEKTGTYVQPAGTAPTYTWGGDGDSKTMQQTMVYGTQPDPAAGPASTPYFTDESEIRVGILGPMQGSDYSSIYAGETDTGQWTDSGAYQYVFFTVLLWLNEDTKKRLLFNFACFVGGLVDDSFRNGDSNGLDFPAGRYISAFDDTGAGSDGTGTMVSDGLTFLGRTFDLRVPTLDTMAHQTSSNDDGTGTGGSKGDATSIDITAAKIEPASFWSYGGAYDETTGEPAQ